MAEIDRKRQLQQAAREMATRQMQGMDMTQQSVHSRAKLTQSAGATQKSVNPTVRPPQSAGAVQRGVNSTVRPVQSAGAPQKRVDSTTGQVQSATEATSSMSQTKEIENRLVKEVAEMMEQQSFNDLVFIEPEAGKQPQQETVHKKANSSQEKQIAGRKKQAVPLDTPEEMTEETKQQLKHWGQVGGWFQTFCWMHIPIFGFWYMVVMAVRKNTTEEKRTFAKAYVLYRLLVLILAMTLLYIFYRMGVSFVEQILAYMEMHT